MEKRLQHLDVCYRKGACYCGAALQKDLRFNSLKPGEEISSEIAFKKRLAAAKRKLALPQ
jgi:hypothetical protein